MNNQTEISTAGFGFFIANKVIRLPLQRTEPLSGFYNIKQLQTGIIAYPIDMKELLYLFLFFAVFVGCTPEEDFLPTVCTLEDRWVVDIQGQANALYEFHNGFRYTIYSDSTNMFGTRAQAIPNPHEYYFIGDSLKIDLNFGNFTVALPSFECDCNKLILSTTQGEVSYYKEGFDESFCD